MRNIIKTLTAEPALAKKAITFLFFNLCFLLYAIHYVLNIPTVILSILINAIIFILPGAAWAALFCKLIDNKVNLLICVISISTAILLLGIVTHIIFNITSSSLSFLIFLVIATNAGFIFVKPQNIKTIIHLFTHKIFFAICIFLIAYMLFFLGATVVVSPFQDHDLDIQHTAYSLLNNLTPC